MREINERIIQESQTASNLLEQFNAIESFLGDFSFLVLGRDNIVCKNYAFSLQKILISTQATLGNIIGCCKYFCLADAYTLLRKYDDRRSIYSMAQFLVQHEVFDRNTAGLIREIINIANRGVHGEIIDEDYLKFVKRTYPAIKQALEHEYAFYSHNNYYFECPKCKYRGPSKYHNVCPKCGMAVDD